VRFQEYFFWSPIMDADACRLSMCDAHGREFFCIVPYDDGKAWRARRDEYLGYITQAIDAGLQPGEVRLRR